MEIGAGVAGGRRHRRKIAQADACAIRCRDGDTNTPLQRRR
ncbi:hypothetical protein LA76x_3806 [Lysobacter antibioticus]|uniref:Uncharacterized protein n=1 Tax=Lysobacter antibioticus TaxID=84531 RepID=A0A0S2FEH4_LYSAN|nr:hypothetical protein LA76x_3806 [Lysobacter antibioticus]